MGAATAPLIASHLLARVRIPDLPRANTQRRPWIMCSINLESISPSFEAALIRK